MEGLEFLLVIAFFTWCGIFIVYQYCKWRIGKNHKREQANELLPPVSGSAWELLDGVYQVGVDKAAPNSKDHSCRVWMKKGVGGEMIIVAEEHYANE